MELNGFRRGFLAFFRIYVAVWPYYVVFGGEEWGVRSLQKIDLVDQETAFVGPNGYGEGSKHSLRLLYFVCGSFLHLIVIEFIFSFVLSLFSTKRI